MLQAQVRRRRTSSPADAEVVAQGGSAVLGPEHAPLLQQDELGVLPARRPVPEALRTAELEGRKEQILELTVNP